MKRHESDGEYFKWLRVLDDFARSEGLSINDVVTTERFLKLVAEKIQSHRKRLTLMHGLRVESLFAHIAAALGSCKLINEEDSGIFFSTEVNICRPDFRIHTHGNGQFFVEVKNFHQSDPSKPYRIKSDYLGKLKAYANIFSIPLKLAIYWSRWNLWCLVDSDHFKNNGQNFQISLMDAMKQNEMAMVGDYMVGTIPPLAFRVYADSLKPRSLDDNNEVGFTIGRVALCVGGNEIVDPKESALAWFFLLYGNWTKIERPAQVTDGQLEYFDISVAPVEYEENQGFAILGSLSSMISKHYNVLTAGTGEIDRLVPQQQPDQLGVLIPRDYKGDVLKLWLFEQKPNYEDLHKHIIQ